MYEILLIGSILLLSSSVAFSLLYYRQVSKAQKEYEAAKNVVGHIIISFNKQLERQGEQSRAISYKLETVSTKHSELAGQLKEHEKRLIDIASKVEGFSEIEMKVKEDLTKIRGKIDRIEETQTEISQRVGETPEVKIEAAIPIRRERALAPLTETELRVLEIIADAGSKTAPQIKSIIKLSREHTARLVKKLYEEGYLERDAGKTPYKYSVKDEMLKILKKPESGT